MENKMDVSREELFDQVEKDLTRKVHVRYTGDVSGSLDKIITAAMENIGMVWYAQGKSKEWRDLCFEIALSNPPAKENQGEQN